MRRLRATIKGGSMSATDTETAAASQYVPFTPFQEGYAFEAEPSTIRLGEGFETLPSVTPFVSEYAGVEAPTPAATELRDLLFELYDQEFDEVLGELADEAWEAVTQRAEPFGETGAPGSAEQFLEEWIGPARGEAETMLENVAQAVSEHDIASMSEAEVDTFFERFAPRDTGLEPYFEDFLGGLLDKAKKLAKTAISVAQKGITLIPGLGGLISKLKALVRPLLRRVLKTAIDKLPATLQPLARQLAQRVLGPNAAEVESEDYAAAPAAPDVTAVQQQFDLEAASLLFATDEADREVAVGEAVNAADREDGAGVGQLHEARARFVDQLEAGVDPEQALEQFIPAIMAVLPIARTVIGIIGRQKVVNTLAKFLAGFVGGYVPQPAATQLSRAIVDAGLRLLKLETPAEAEAGGPRLACETIAQTVEDTVRRVTELDESSFEEPARLEAAMTEAFHAAAAENFPPQLLLPELHEAPLRATWVAMPVGKRHKRYRKYGQTFDVEITPQMADSITTFGATKLSAFLKDQLGVVPPVRAKVHLYQAIPGTTLGRIAYYERTTARLAMPPRTGKLQLHPLTVQAAATLLQQPKLGRNVPGEFLSSRRSIAIGGRFYFLEIAGARPVTVMTAGQARPAVRRSSQVNVTLDFPKDEFRVFVYLSEADAQEIAGKIRKQDLTSVLMLAKRVYEAGVNAALGGEIHRHVKILTEALPQEQLFGRQLRQLAGDVRKRLMDKVVAWIGKALTDYLKAGAGELVAAADDPADGVTIIVQIGNPPGAPLVRRLLRGEGIGIGALGDLGSLFKGEPKLAVKTVAGYRFD
jgi:hypothetical protein